MTILWTEEALCQATGGVFHNNTSPCPPITGVSIDTRTLAKGDMFVALKGENQDGHAHLEEAFAKGASCAMVAHDSRAHGFGSLTPQYPALVVDDPFKGLQKLAFAARKRFKGTMLAVTGSVGKTTTKNMLQAAFSAYGVSHAADASYNNHIGVPLTLARLPAEAQFAICEIGMNHQGEVLPLAQMVQPDLAIITTIASAHIGHMGNMEAIAQEKASLLQALHSKGAAFVPFLPHFFPVFKASLPSADVKFYTTDLSNPSANLYATDLILEDSGSQFIAHLPKDRPESFQEPSPSHHLEHDPQHSGEQNISVTLSSGGKHLIYSALITLGALWHCGLPLRKGCEAIAQFQPGKGRGGLYNLNNGDLLLIDESYNASALSIRNSLSTLGLYKNRRHIAILGDIRELGPFSQSEHESLAPDVMANADLVFCAGPEMKHLYNKLPFSLQGGWQASAQTLIDDIFPALRKGDVILVKGSNASRMGEIVQKLLQTYRGGILI
ncbi:UDP-N-acetylmuramoyl-tripeptide--D-alanyl-D-alanine ligase [Entomobacter blattae]|uniref:UDP-N-acetylmuramoyl-tripeptide--D-alanyl-D-alanine ligase n=1 Tax=Entomobacter blattae TaxID=2762277 RepID=A0A7H1NNR6_9PROT|nr:Mur ligase family protein [Entomobacter blattae]QNT77426.1 UDP-N-acetylmuramoyl-tripeptide--D-alanyl-D-alanine ligase [Entomobacter blattae]